MNEGRSKKGVSRRTLEHWYRAYTPLMYHKLRNLGLNRQEREDIVSETWLKVMRTGYDGSGVFVSYLTRMTMNAGIDALRRRSRLNTREIRPELRVSAGISLEADLEVRRILAFTCLQLSLVQCMAWITLIYAGRPYRDASRMLHAPEATLKTRMRRVTALLREPARYSTYPTSIALPAGYMPRGDGWRMLPQEDQEYTLFTRDSEVPVLEVVCRYVDE